MQETSSWTGVGVHPTPARLVRGFARAVSAAAASKYHTGIELNVLDACSGDGRLGHAVAKRLSRLGFRLKLTLIEADPRRVLDRSTAYDVEQIIGNFYSFYSSRIFDVVVSNPPYLAINRAEAERLGFDWSHVVDCGQNLYGLALEKCLSICKSSGVIGLLAPHGWLRNWRGDGLRRIINRDVARVDIYASANRRLFPGVNQDVAAQVFEMKGSRAHGAVAKVRISYDQAGFYSISLPARTKNPPEINARVRVGPFVWNREKDLLSIRTTGLPVVYGGNITRDGRLNFNVSRYAGRNFVAKTRVPPSYISQGSCLLIKRSLRGTPGSWKVDAVFLANSAPFVAENHVIVIEFTRTRQLARLREMCERVVRAIEDDHRHHGHPNISASVVRRVVAVCEMETLKFSVSK